MSVRENRHVYFCIIEGWRGVPACEGMRSLYLYNI